MLFVNNLLKLVDGKLIVVLIQDMVLGIYYFIFEKKGDKGEGMIFLLEEEVFLVYEYKVVGFYVRIKVKRIV